MADINRILSLIDEYLESTRQDRAEANEISMYLDKNGAIRHAGNGLPFRKLLRAGKIPNAQQPGGKGTSWYILDSNGKRLANSHLTRKKTESETYTAKGMTTVTEGLEPIADSESEILILGTLPGKVSLKTKQYYANPTNQFWTVISNIFNDTIPTSYEEKLKVLKRNHLALWDVLKAANQDSSLDSDITNPVANDILGFITKHPKLRVIGFNGGKAETYFRTYIGLHNLPGTVHTVSLPSLSSSNTHSTVADKIGLWKSILKL